MSKKLMKVFLTLTAIVMIASCTATTDENLKTTAVTTAANEAVYYGNASLALAKLVAETYLIEHETINDWENATLDEPYPLYNPATDVITYLEYPVIKDGKRKGYIMVTLKEDEPRVVEASENSEMTNYEALADKAGTTDIKAVRFSFASFVAEAPTVSRSGNRKVLAALGNIEYEIEIGEVSRSGSSYEEIINNYKERVEKNGGFLDINKDVYEANKEWIDYRNGYTSRGDISDADLSPIVTEISDYSSLSPTMILNQFYVKFSNGSSGPSGCVPTAGVIGIAYYARKFNCKTLFGGILPPDKKIFYGNGIISEGDDNVADVVFDLRKKLNMIDNGSYTSHLANVIIQYMKENGLPVAYHATKHRGNSWDCMDLDALKKTLDRDEPAYLDYYEDESENKNEHGWHCAIIYKAEIQRDWAGNYKECTYYINPGWGEYRLYDKNITTWNFNIEGFTEINLQVL